MLAPRTSAKLAGLAAAFKLSVAISAVTEIAQLQERLYLTDRTYGVLFEFAECDEADTVGIDSNGHVVVAGAGLYDVTMTVASASAFTIRATAKNT